MKILRIFLIFLFLFFTFYTTHKIKKEILLERDLVEERGIEAPKFSLKNLNGKEVSIEDFKQSAVILIFFATWCGPCKMELELIKEEEYFLSNYNIKLFLISSEDKEKVKSFMEKNGFNFEVLLDEKGDIFKAYNVKAIPKSVIIDEKGKIIFSKVGMINNVFTLTKNLPYRFVVPAKERILYKRVDKILDSISCPCNCGKSILNCECEKCDLKNKKETIKYYAGRLLDKEKFKEDQIVQIIKWKYIENVQEKK